MPKNPIPYWERQLYSNIGKRLRRIRHIRGLGLRHVAAASGLRLDSIQKYEVGLQRIPLSKLIRLATALGVPPAYFLDNHAPELTKPCQPSQASEPLSKP